MNPNANSVVYQLAFHAARDAVIGTESSREEREHNGHQMRRYAKRWAALSGVGRASTWAQTSEPVPLDGGRERS
jgi:hypothetical protein